VQPGRLQLDREFPFDEQIQTVAADLPATVDPTPSLSHSTRNPALRSSIDNARRSIVCRKTGPSVLCTVMMRPMILSVGSVP